MIALLSWLLLTFGLTLLMLSGYLEWKTKKQPGSRPHHRLLFIVSGRLATLLWFVIIIDAFHSVAWYVVISAALMSIIIPALFAQKIISRDKAPVVVIIGFLVGLIACVFSYPPTI